jgi:hypothetical protein
MTRLITLFNRLERQIIDADEAVTIAGDRARNGLINLARADVLHIAVLIAKAENTARALVIESLKHNERNDQ